MKKNKPLPAKKTQKKPSDEISSLRGYASFLKDLKTRIRSAQIKAAFAVNSEMISLYWEIGKGIVERQENAGWGDEVLEKLSKDLRHEFPEMQGFSRRNLYRMRAIYLAYKDVSKFVPQLVAQIPWGHSIVLIEKVKDYTEREWYIRQTIENGWSRVILVHQIETKLYQRQVKVRKTTNFARTLPQPQSELVEQALKDPYIFDFLTLGNKAKEKDLENALLEKIKNFLLELGAGFAFIGSQFHIEVDGKDFYLDLVFYHYYLRRLFVIDLKMKEFKPEYAGKMNFYLSALDDMVRHPDDNPSVGIILCKGKTKTVAEYALRDINKPIGISQYRLSSELEKLLPDVHAFEKLLSDEDETNE